MELVSVGLGRRTSKVHNWSNMRWTVISLVVLATWQFETIQAKKVVVVMGPRHVRRTPATSGLPLRHIMAMMRLRGIEPMNVSPSRYSSHPGPHGWQPPAQKLRATGVYPHPQGGDDFDQPHDNRVNNVIVPHGKDTSHAISFGNGYIPFESLPTNGQSHPFRYDSYSSASADSRLGGQIEPVPQKAGVYLIPTNIVPSNVQPPNDHQQHQQQQPQQQGVILRDSVILDNYNRKVAELTQNWSASFGGNEFVSAGVGPGTGVGNGPKNWYVNQGGPGKLLLSGPNNYNVISAPIGHHHFGLPETQRGGYAVKEETGDPPHDFRTMPIDTGAATASPSPLQRLVQQAQNLDGDYSLLGNYRP